MPLGTTREVSTETYTPQGPDPHGSEVALFARTGRFGCHTGRMSLTRTQTILTVTVKGTDLNEAPDKLTRALEPYPDARIVTMTQKSNWMTSLRGDTSLLVVIEYTPDGQDE